MANKYMSANRTDGSVEEVEFLVESNGATDAGKGVALDASGKLDDSVMPVGIGAEVEVIPATEDLVAGNSINIYNSSGSKCRKADATAASPKPCHGFILDNVTSGQNATVYLDGNITGLSGLTPGLPVFLGKTAGTFTQDVSSYTTGDLFQDLGVASKTDTIRFNYSKPIKLA